MLSKFQKHNTDDVNKSDNNISIQTCYSNEDKDEKLIKICENVLTSKPYINYEYEVKINEYTNNKKKYDDDAVVRLQIMHQYITDAMNILLNTNNFTNKKFDIAMAKSHGKTKNGKHFSFFYRFIVNGSFRFRNTYEAKQLVNIIKSISKHPEITKHIDTSCYGKTPTDKQQIDSVFVENMICI